MTIGERLISEACKCTDNQQSNLLVDAALEINRLLSENAELRRDAERYRAILNSKHLSWGYNGRGGECVKAELPLAGEPIWSDVNEFDFTANFNAAVDKLIQSSKEEANG